MRTVIHLYLKKGSTVAAAVHVVKHTFTPAGGSPNREPLTWSHPEQAEKLAIELANPAVKVVYICAGCIAKKPKAYSGAWIEVAAGSPIENI